MVKTKGVKFDELVIQIVSEFDIRLMPQTHSLVPDFIICVYVRKRDRKKGRY